jgi:type II secretory pathway pseudopilin PulG
VNSQQGFTLIEALAGGILSTIVAGAILSALNMTTRQIKESSSNLSLGQIQTVVSEQIRSDARKSFGAKGPGENPTAQFDTPEDDPALTNQNGIVFCDSNGQPFARYQINTSTGNLEEWIDGSYVPFKVGSQTAQLDAANSSFGVLAKRQGITFKLVCRVLTDKYYTFPAIQETVLGRDIR